MFTRDDLRALVTERAHPAVSIYLPTHVKGREIRQDPIRLKNLLDRAQEQLVAAGQRPDDARALLAPGRARLEDELFWRHQDQGLAIFLAPGVHREHRVPAEFDEQVTLGRRFHIKPLLPLLAVDGRFYLLTVTGRHARLFEATRFAMRERQELAVPQGVEAAGAESGDQPLRHSDPAGRPRRDAPAPLAPGAGRDADELRRNEEADYLRRVIAAAADIVAADPAPVILAAHPEIRGHIRKMRHLPMLVDDDLDLNPDAFSPEELHRRSFEQLKPLFLSAREDALARFNTLLGNDDGRATCKVDEIVKAAHYSRVEMLFLAEGEAQWGVFDAAADRVATADGPGGERIDLLDDAAAQTLLHGGRVDLLPRTEMPRQAAAAAILRY